MRKFSLEEINAVIRPVAGPIQGLPASADVIVVGAGPIGLTAANQLGRLGVRVVLVERNAMTADLPRALAVDDEFMRQLDNLGLLSALQPHTSAPFGIHFHAADGTPLIKVPAIHTRNGYGNRNGVMQPVLEKVLLAAATQVSNVQVNYGCEVTDIQRVANSIRVVVSTPAGQRAVEAPFLLACDGARSFVRTRLGIPFEGQRIDEPHLVLDLADFPDDAPYSKFHCDPRRPFNSIPTPYGGRRLEFMLNDTDDRDAISRPDGFGKLIDATSYRGARTHVVRSVVYGYSQRIAARMQDGNVFLLGDAAHVMPPFGAQAMNTGARDVNNLCWKLHAVLSGSADNALLATYEPERRPQISAIVRYSVRIGRLANIRSAPLALVRDYAFRLLNLLPPVRRYLSSMRYMPRPRIEAGFIAGDTDSRPLLGRPFPRIMLRNSVGSLVSFDELSGSSFSVVAIDLTSGELERLKHHPLLVALRPHFIEIETTQHANATHEGVHRLDDVSDLAEHSGDVLLVRPDRYVAAAAPPAQVAGAFDKLMALLAPLNRALDDGDTFAEEASARHQAAR